MAEEGSSFSDALAEAQRLGYAEPDPTADIEGHDAAAKATIIATIAFGARVKIDDVYREGITQVTEDDIDDSVRCTAHLFQAWVPKAHEVRLTVVDHQLFAVRIDGGSVASQVDWRTDYPSLCYSVVEVPDATRRKVRQLMLRLRLRFGALDFVVGPDDTWTFLEINPNGQWAWLQDATGLPIAAAIADVLVKGDDDLR